MNPAWAVLELIPRRRAEGSKRPGLFGVTIPFFERRTIPEGARVHRSVIDRAAAIGARPPNLPAGYEIEEPASGEKPGGGKGGGGPGKTRKGKTGKGKTGKGK